MKKGQRVAMYSKDGMEMWEGKTIENESTSPTEKEIDRKVIRVRWDDDGRQTIENVKDLF